MPAAREAAEAAAAQEAAAGEGRIEHGAFVYEMRGGGALLHGEWFVWCVDLSEWHTIDHRHQWRRGIVFRGIARVSCARPAALHGSGSECVLRQHLWV